MAKKSGSTKWLLVAGVAAVAYYLWQKNQAAAIITAPVAGTLAPVSTSAPIIGTGSASTPTASVANDPRLTDIRQWITQLDAANQRQATNALAIMTQDEIAGLYDIVHNDFYGNGITTPAQTAFWNAWRVKYHVLDGTYA